jgi:hypothetical protein
MMGEEKSGGICIREEKRGGMYVREGEEKRRVKHEETLGVHRLEKREETIEVVDADERTHGNVERIESEK